MDRAPQDNDSIPDDFSNGTPVPSKFAVGEVFPKRVSAPQGQEEIGEILGEANSRKWAVVPFGAGMHQHIGNQLQRYDVALSLENLNQIPEYEPQDLVVKVESGCRLHDLQNRLAGDHLYLPIDPPGMENATIGGIVSANVAGPLRFSQGTIRDYLIGISLIQPDGRWTKFGARVVKNVTGYDMCKLYVGSFGTLGVITDFFFKLKPIPPASKTIAVCVKGLHESRIGLEKLIHSSLCPVALELLNPEGLKILNERFHLFNDPDHYAFLVRFMDVEKSVDWQREQLEKMWQGIFIKGIVLGSTSEEIEVWGLLREDKIWLESDGSSKVKLKINSRSSQMVDLIQQLEHFGREQSHPAVIKVHAGNGIIRVYYELDPSPPAMQAMVDHITALRIFLKNCRGTVVLECGPASLKKAVDVWGYDFKDKIWMEKIRKQFDPNQVLNPGRYVV